VLIGTWALMMKRMSERCRPFSRALIQRDISLSPITTSTISKSQPEPTHVDRFPDPREHAIAILLALDGDYAVALKWMDMYADEYGYDYALRLITFLKPQGRC
jgi:hypothetical protein